MRLVGDGAVSNVAGALGIGGAGADEAVVALAVVQVKGVAGLDAAGAVRLLGGKGRERKGECAVA